MWYQALLIFHWINNAPSDVHEKTSALRMSVNVTLSFELSRSPSTTGFLGIQA